MRIRFVHRICVQVLMGHELGRSRAEIIFSDSHYIITYWISLHHYILVLSVVTLDRGPLFYVYILLHVRHLSALDDSHRYSKSGHMARPSLFWLHEHLKYPRPPKVKVPYLDRILVQTKVPKQKSQNNVKPEQPGILNLSRPEKNANSDKSSLPLVTSYVKSGSPKRIFGNV